MSPSVSSPKSNPKGAQDAALIAKIAQKDRQAFAAFFSDYAVRVKAFLIRYGTSPADADDLAQDVMASQLRTGRPALRTL